MTAESTESSVRRPSRRHRRNKSGESANSNNLVRTTILDCEQLTPQQSGPQLRNGLRETYRPQWKKLALRHAIAQSRNPQIRCHQDLRL
jgi:hypothetical protein